MQWLGPMDLALPLQQFKEVESQANYYFGQENGSAIPRHLLTHLLSESMSSDSHAHDHALLGNRLSVEAWIDGTTLLAHPTGQALELPALTVLPSTQHPISHKVQTVTPGGGLWHPILQMLFACKHDGDEPREIPLLAVRSQHWVKLYRVQAPPEEQTTPPAAHASTVSQGGGGTGSHAQASDDSIIPDSEDEGQEHGKDEARANTAQAQERITWSMREIASLQSQSSILNVAWNPHIARDLLFVCHDGSVNLADVTASAPGWPNDIRHEKIYQLEASPVPSCSSCCWGQHPRFVYLAEGPKVLRLDLRRSTATPACSVVHCRSEGVTIVCMAACRESPNFLALATHTSTVLLDTTNPSAALLKWKCGTAPIAPQYLLFTMKPVEDQEQSLESLQESIRNQKLHEEQEREAAMGTDYLASQLSQAAGMRRKATIKNPAPAFCQVGCITACNFWKGGAQAYRFGKAAGIVGFTAHPQDLTKVEEDEFGTLQWPFGNILVELGLSVAEDEKPWESAKPGVADRYHALGLPQNLAYPLAKEQALKEWFDLKTQPETDSRRASEGVADIIGIGIVDSRLSDNAYGETLVRLDALGNVYLDPAELFSEARCFGSSCCKHARHELEHLSHQLQEDKSAGNDDVDNPAKGQGKAKKEMRAWPKILMQLREQWRAQASNTANRQNDRPALELERLSEILMRLKIPATPAQTLSIAKLEASMPKHEAEKINGTSHVLQGRVPTRSDGLKFLSARVFENLPNVKQHEKVDPSRVAAHLQRAAHWLALNSREDSLSAAHPAEFTTALDKEVSRSKNLLQTEQFHFPEPYEMRPAAVTASGAASGGTRLFEATQAGPIGTQQGSQAVPLAARENSANCLPCLREWGGQSAVYPTEDGASTAGRARLPILSLKSVKASQSVSQMLQSLEEKWMVKQASLWEEPKRTAAQPTSQAPRPTQIVSPVRPKSRKRVRKYEEGF